MKRFIFYICTFVFVSFASGNSKKIGSVNDNYNTCLTENNVSDDDMFTMQDIIDNKHKQSENQERIKKNGCVIQCMFKKMGLMEGSEYDIEKMHIELTKKTNSQPGSDYFEALNNCIDETKDLTEKCEKSFALTECFLKAEKKISSHVPNIANWHLANYTRCLTKNNVLDDDIYKKQDIIEYKHKQPENQERSKKNGCVLHCLFEGLNIMHELELDVEKAKDKFALTSDELGQAILNCSDDVKDMTNKCDKAFALTTCFIKAVNG